MGSSVVVEADRRKEVGRTSDVETAVGGLETVVVVAAVHTAAASRTPAELHNPSSP